MSYPVFLSLFLPAPMCHYFVSSISQERSPQVPLFPPCHLGSALRAFSPTVSPRFSSQLCPVRVSLVLSFPGLRALLPWLSSGPGLLPEVPRENMGTLGNTVRCQEGPRCSGGEPRGERGADMKEKAGKPSAGPDGGQVERRAGSWRGGGRESGRGKGQDPAFWGHAGCFDPSKVLGLPEGFCHSP